MRGNLSVAAWLSAAVLLAMLLHAGSAFFVPLVLAVLMTYALAPPVDWLERAHLPRPVGTALVLACVAGAAGWVTLSLQDDAAALVDQIPRASRTLGESIRSVAGGDGPLSRLREAARELESVTEAVPAPARPVRRAPASEPPSAPTVLPAMVAMLRAQLTALFGVLIQIGTATVMAFFLLSAGDHFRRTLMRTMGPSLARRRQTFRVLEDITQRLQRYLFTLVISNVLIALCAWGFFAWMGVEQPALWGALAGLFHVVPYIGTTVVAVASMVIGMAQFGSVGPALALGAGTVIIAGGIGNVAGTWLQGRACEIDPAVAIIALAAFGALWGGWGLLLALPILAVVKTIGDHIEGGEAWAIWIGPVPAHLSARDDQKDRTAGSAEETDGDADRVATQGQSPIARSPR